MKKCTLSRWLVPTILILAALFPSAPSARAQVKEVYHDFRNRKPFPDTLNKHGPHPDKEMTPEAEGLRITLPAERGNHWPAEVSLDSPLEGDFEFTATFELLSAERPKKGYGVGVNLSVADNTKRALFAKVSRIFHQGYGSAYLTEYWDRAIPKSYKVVRKDTNMMAGQLRLVRVGESLRYLVSEGPGKAFEEIWFQEKFGAGELQRASFSVTDAGESGNPVDARLIDLRVRTGKIDPEKATALAPLDAPAPVDHNALPVADMPKGERSRNTLLIVLGGGAGVLLLLVVVIGAVLLLRRRPSVVDEVDEVEEVEPPATTIVACTGCGKKLKVKAETVGKKVKCPKCGAAVLVSA